MTHSGPGNLLKAIINDNEFLRGLVWPCPGSFYPMVSSIDITYVVYNVLILSNDLIHPLSVIYIQIALTTRLLWPSHLLSIGKSTFLSVLPPKAEAKRGVYSQEN